RQGRHSSRYVPPGLGGWPIQPHPRLVLRRGKQWHRPRPWTNMAPFAWTLDLPMAASPIESLLRRLGSGDHVALGEVYDRCAGLVTGLALRILRNRTEAEDVVQEVFLQVWRQAGRFDPGRGSPEAWICTITRTRALDRLRRRASRREEPGEAAPNPGHPPKT